MPTRIGIGISIKLDSFIAGKEAARKASYEIGKRHPDIIIVFISPIFNQEDVIKGIRSIIVETPLVGCSSVGSITSYGSFKNSVTVCAISSGSIRFYYGIGSDISKNPRLAGSKAVKQSLNLKNTVRRQAYIMLSDCLSGGNMLDVLRGAQEVLGTGFPIIGGGAIDNLQFQKTYQYLNNSVYTDSVVGFLIGGNIKIGIGKAHGWQPIGKPHKITRARSNIIKEIDKRKAVELYEEYLGKTCDELKIEGIAKLGASYPLGVEIGQKKEYLIRVPLKIKDNSSLVLSADIPEHKDISLMIGDKNSALEAAKRSCIEALGNSKATVRFAMVFSDIGRLQLLRKDSQSEVEIIREILGKDVPFFGCYVCGEYAPIDIQENVGQSYFHNQVISIAVFSE